MKDKGGYSSTPLAKKLGLKSGSAILIYNSPKPYHEFFGDFPSDIKFTSEGQQTADFIHLFATSMAELELAFHSAKPCLKMNGSLWVSWPKKAAKITTDIDKFVVMKYGQDNGLVDTKVASVDDTWSGHKFMYRLKDRKGMV